MLTVSKIEWISRTSEEAEVTLVIGALSCCAFCHPCRYSVGDQVAGPLHVFGLRQALLAADAQPIIERIKPPELAQRGSGRIVNLANGEVQIGDMRLLLDDPLPGGLCVGDMIEFECARIDLW